MIFAAVLYLAVGACVATWFCRGDVASDDLTAGLNFAVFAVGWPVFLSVALVGLSFVCIGRWLRG